MPSSSHQHQAQPTAAKPAHTGQVLAATLLLAGLLSQSVPSTARAFHDGGAASCEACHIMHDATPGQILMNGSDPLLTFGTASDVCLACHGGPNGVLADNPTLPGPERGAGNYVFLLEDNLNDAADGQTNVIEGHAAGHSIISQEYGLTADPRWSAAPGGSYPSGQLGCTSCHDPHGNTNFRMLYGAGEIQGGAATFVYDAPQAVGLDITDPLQTESPAAHTAYLAGVSNWCSNCHGRYHGEGHASKFEHEYNESLEGEHVTRYNRYEGTASPTTGNWATAYLPEVPFEEPTMTTTATNGPSRSSRVMCLSCHRAHASSAPAAGRWDFRVTDLNQDGRVSGSYALPNPFGGGQGQLCEKCHTSTPNTSHYQSGAQ